MFELSYKSKAIDTIIEKDIVEILNSAQEFNSENNITGCLVFYENSFIQILEGEKSVVKQIFAKICQDSRHENIRVLAEGDKDIRFFPNWDMAYTSINKDKCKSDDVLSYANNLLLLSEFIEKPTTTLKMFWAGINRLIVNPAF